MLLVAVAIANTFTLRLHERESSAAKSIEKKR
jgi:hypothetical protein